MQFIIPLNIDLHEAYFGFSLLGQGHPFPSIRFPSSLLSPPVLLDVGCTSLLEV